MDSEEETEAPTPEEVPDENPAPESTPSRRPDYQQRGAGRCVHCG